MNEDELRESLAERAAQDRQLAAEGRLRARAEAAEAQLAEAKETIESLSNALTASEVLRKQSVATLTAKLSALVEAQEAVINESAFNLMRFAEEDDTDYFLRCFRSVKDRLRAAHEALRSNTNQEGKADV